MSFIVTSLRRGSQVQLQVQFQFQFQVQFRVNKKQRNNPKKCRRIKRKPIWHRMMIVRSAALLPSTLRLAAAPAELAARLGADYESAWPILPCASRSPRAPASTSDLLRAPARTSKPPTPALASIPRLGFHPGGGFDFNFDLFEPAPSYGAPNAPGACSELFEGE